MRDGASRGYFFNSVNDFLAIHTTQVIQAFVLHCRSQKRLQDSIVQSVDILQKGYETVVHYILRSIFWT